MKILLASCALTAARAVTAWIPAPATADVLAVIPRVRKSTHTVLGAPRSYAVDEAYEKARRLLVEACRRSQRRRSASEETMP